MRHSQNAGQAMVEMTVGLVAVMVLLCGLIQIGRLAHARSVTMATAREDAGLLAMSTTAPARPLQNRYIYDWHPGPDRRYFTHDDVALTATGVVDALRQTTLATGMAGLPPPPHNPFADMATVMDPAGDFALVQSRSTRPVAVLPLIQRLVYRRASIRVESEVWLVWTEGLY